jgi:hypothetical protein
MLKLQEIARSLEDFVKIVSDLENKESKADEWSLWYRGQASAQWNLVQRLYRCQNRKADRRTEDDERILKKGIESLKQRSIDEVKQTFNQLLS